MTDLWRSHKKRLILILGLGIFLLGAPPVLAQEPEIAVRHIFITPFGQEAVKVEERLVLAQEAPDFIVQVPPGAVDLKVKGGAAPQDYEILPENRLALKNLEPGVQLVLEYTLNSGAAHVVYSGTAEYPVDELAIFFPRDAFNAQAIGLSDFGVMSFETTGEVQVFGAVGLSAGDEYTLALLSAATGSLDTGNARVPENSPPVFHNPGHIRLWRQSPFSGIDAHLFLILVLGIPVAGIIYWQTQRRKKPPIAFDDLENEDKRFQDLLVRQRVLKEQLVELDLQQARGDLPVEEYETKRRILKEKLVQTRFELEQLSR